MVAVRPRSMFSRWLPGCPPRSVGVPCLHGGRAHALAACGVATLCCLSAPRNRRNSGTSATSHPALAPRVTEPLVSGPSAGTLWGFVSMLVSSSQTLEGAPKPAFYDGLLPLTTTWSPPGEVEGGWRKVAADGETLVAPDCFVAMNRFKIAKGQEAAFEQRCGSPQLLVPWWLRCSCVLLTVVTFRHWQCRGARRNQSPAART